MYYLPRHILRDLELSTEVVTATTDAEALLGQLHGMSMLLTDPAVLTGPLLRKEAALWFRLRLEHAHHRWG